MTDSVRCSLTICRLVEFVKYWEANPNNNLMKRWAGLSTISRYVSFWISALVTQLAQLFSKDEKDFNVFFSYPCLQTFLMSPHWIFWRFWRCWSLARELSTLLSTAGSSTPGCQHHRSAGDNQDNRAHLKQIIIPTPPGEPRQHEIPCKQGENTELLCMVCDIFD